MNVYIIVHKLAMIDILYMINTRSTRSDNLNQISNKQGFFRVVTAHSSLEYAQSDF